MSNFIPSTNGESASAAIGQLSSDGFFCIYTYNLKGVSDDPDGHQLFTVVAAVHHQGVGETLDDGALSLAEALGSIATGRVGDVDGRPDLDVVAARLKTGKLATGTERIYRV